MEKYLKILLKIEKYQIAIEFQHIVLNKSIFELNKLTLNVFKNITYLYIYMGVIHNKLIKSFRFDFKKSNKNFFGLG